MDEHVNAADQRRDPESLLNWTERIMHNLAEEPVVVTLCLPEDRLINLLSEAHSQKKDGVHRVSLELYGYRWYRAGGLDYLLKRRTS